MKQRRKWHTFYRTKDKSSLARLAKHFCNFDAEVFALQNFERFKTSSSSQRGTTLPSTFPDAVFDRVLDACSMEEGLRVL